MEGERGRGRGTEERKACRVHTVYTRDTAEKCRVWRLLQTLSLWMSLSLPCDKDTISN